MYATHEMVIVHLFQLLKDQQNKLVWPFCIGAYVTCHVCEYIFSGDAKRQADFTVSEWLPVL